MNPMSSVPLRERDGQPATRATVPAVPVRTRVERPGNDGIRIVIKTSGGVALLPLTEIECLEADGNVVVVHSAAGEQHRIRESLSHMFDQLRGRGFIRVHRGTIVNANAIVAIEKGRYRKAFCVLRNGGRFEIGRVEFQRLRPLWQTGVLDLNALSAGLTLVAPTP
jgi:DNA-binding LytR/AlgR family response regulator